MEKAFEITPDDGKIVFVGVPDDKISIYSLPLAFKKDFKGISWRNVNTSSRYSKICEVNRK